MGKRFSGNGLHLRDEWPGLVVGQPSTSVRCAASCTSSKYQRTTVAMNNRRQIFPANGSNACHVASSFSRANRHVSVSRAVGHGCRTYLTRTIRLTRPTDRSGPCRENVNDTVERKVYLETITDPSTLRPRDRRNVPTRLTRIKGLTI